MNTWLSHEQLLQAIIGLEERMFVAAKAQPSSLCQQRLDTFRMMRRMSHCVLSSETLASYLQDLKDAFDRVERTGCCGVPCSLEFIVPIDAKLRRNFFTEKYARIEGRISPLKESSRIDEIVELESGWLRDLESRYPRVLHATVAFERYLRAELETYSDHTLELYARDLHAAKEQGRNLVEERYNMLATLEDPIHFTTDFLQGEAHVR